MNINPHTKEVLPSMLATETELIYIQLPCFFKAKTRGELELTIWHLEKNFLVEFYVSRCDTSFKFSSNTPAGLLLESIEASI